MLVIQITFFSFSEGFGFTIWIIFSLQYMHWRFESYFVDSAPVLIVSMAIVKVCLFSRQIRISNGFFTTTEPDSGFAHSKKWIYSRVHICVNSKMDSDSDLYNIRLLGNQFWPNEQKCSFFNCAKNLICNSKILIQIRFMNPWTKWAYFISLVNT